MASDKWRGAELHVDHFEEDTGADMTYSRVRHTLTWSQLRDAVRNRSYRLPQSLEYKIRSELSKRHFNQKPDPSCYGSGRAELLHLNWNPILRVPGSTRSYLSRSTTSSKNHTQISKTSDASNINSNTNLSVISQPDWLFDKQTLYIKYLPSNLSIHDLKSVVESFGTVSNCKIINKKDELYIGYVRMEDVGTCSWVISYFQGRPYEDTGDPVECGFASDLVL